MSKCNDNGCQCSRCAPFAESPEGLFLLAVASEVRRARLKFPEQASQITGLALAEESGEAVKALLHTLEGKGNEQQLYSECVQTAAMALRLAMENQDRQSWPGNKRGCGGSYEVGSGGHVPGTPGEGCPSCDRDFESPKFKRRID